MFGAKRVDVGYFAQHQLDELNPAATPYDHMMKLMPEATEAQRRTRLGTYGFSADKADTKCAKLSGGEKARLLLALAAFHAPHLLILDEPTNHLDVDSRQALVQALAAKGVTSFALELIPRITRAQSMDILSSQANLAGYKAVLSAANQYGRILPQMMTPGGTLAPSRAFIMGVGVAGLQAIATARRLGAGASRPPGPARSRPPASRTWRVSFSTARSFFTSSGAQSAMAMPSAPMRPVRPMRWT